MADGKWQAWRRVVRAAAVAACCVGLGGAAPRLPKVPAAPPAEKPPAAPPPPATPPAASVLHRLKEATALVVVDKARSASAFCVNSAGLFVTHRKVIDDAHAAAGGTVTLVVDGGEPTQRQLPAKVIRMAEEVALLQVEDDGSRGPAPFTPLSVDNNANPGGQWVVTVGGTPTTAVPPGPKLAPVPQAVTPTIVCWFYYKPKAHWHSVHLETAVPAGTDGGAVVGERGHVIGVMNTGNADGQRKVAAPATAIYRLAATPVISVRVGKPDVRGKRAFTAAVFTALGKLKDPTVTLSIGYGPTAVKVPMVQVAPGAFTVDATPTGDGKDVKYTVTVTDGTTAVGDTDGKVDLPAGTAPPPSAGPATAPATRPAVAAPAHAAATGDGGFAPVHLAPLG